jgi:hypothetical protein
MLVGVRPKCAAGKQHAEAAEHIAGREMSPDRDGKRTLVRSSSRIRKTFKAARYRAHTMRTNGRFVAGWTAVSILAQSACATLAFIAAAISPVGILPVILLEACLLGVGQRVILRRAAPGLERGWFAATLIGILAGRYVQFGADISPAAAAVANWPVVSQIALGAALGLLVGALMAIPQTWILAARLRHAWRWVAIRAVAWSIALPALMIAGSFLADASGGGFAVLVATMFATFALVGAFVGLVEGVGLAYLIGLPAGGPSSDGGTGRLATSLAGPTFAPPGMRH